MLLVPLLIWKCTMHMICNQQPHSLDKDESYNDVHQTKWIKKNISIHIFTNINILKNDDTGFPFSFYTACEIFSAIKRLHRHKNDMKDTQPITWTYSHMNWQLNNSHVNLFKCTGHWHSRVCFCCPRQDLKVPSIFKSNFDNMMESNYIIKWYPHNNTASRMMLIELDIKLYVAIHFAHCTLQKSLLT